MTDPNLRDSLAVASPLESLAAVEAHAASIARPGDVVVTMGAGDVDEVARGLGRRLR